MKKERKTADINTAQIYKDYYLPYIESKPEGEVLYSNEKNNVCKSYDIRDKALFRDVISMMNVMVMDRIYKKGYAFKMPRGLGVLRMYQYKRPFVFNEDGSLNKMKNKVNWGATRKLWREKWPDLEWSDILALQDKPKVFHMNDHAPELAFYLKWLRYSRVKNCRAYCFDRTRGGVENYDGKDYHWGNRGFSKVLFDEYSRPEYPVLDIKEMRQRAKSRRSEYKNK